jgi:hypothetical protein
MKKRNILKGAAVLLIASVLILTSVVVTADTGKYKLDSNVLERDIIFEDGFESYADWLIDFPPWTTIDVNGDPTFSHSAYTWPGAGDPYAFIIFNPSTTTPPMTGDPDAQPYAGDKYCAGFNNDNVGYTNDDWLISPQLGPADFDDVTFWAKSYLDTYNYELFEVSVSTTDTDPSSFTVISPTEQPGHTAWEEFSYNLDNFDGETIYIGIHMISIDSWFLMIDEFSVTGSDVQPAIPDLDCDGSLSFTDIEPGATVNGTFTVENIGDPLSLLDWEIDSYPTWGTFTFAPNGGLDLTPAAGAVTVTVEIVAPDEPEAEFEGEIVLVNSEDSGDTCVINVALATPMNQISLQSSQGLGVFAVKKNLIQNLLAGPVIFEQLPWDPSNPGLQGFFADEDQGYWCYDNFWDLTAPIQDVHWWGLEAYSDLDPTGSTFVIEFFNDDGTGIPDIASPVASFTAVAGTDITATNTGVMYFTSYPLYYLEYDLPEDVEMTDGWVAIWKQASGGAERWVWIEGDGDMYCYNSGDGIMTTHDWAFQLTGEGVEPAIPDLDCDGSLSWINVTAGETVTGTFTVENIGDDDSLLDWEIESYPDWGTFTFDPNGGTDLPKGAPVTVDVEVVAPPDEETEFEGEIVIVNSEDPDDICIINVVLATPVSQQSLISLFFEMFAQRFPIIAQILAAIF